MHILLFCVLLFLSAPLYAEQAMPLEIEADNSLEWNREANTFAATGNAIARHDDAVVKADILLAKYKETADGKIHIESITATGAPLASKGDDMITAKKLTAFLGASNKMERIEARGDVKITSPKETATSRLALYDFESEIAVMSGDVILKRGSNVLKGDKAEFNLSTNVARIFSEDQKGDGTKRVRGIFYVDEN